MAAMMVRGNLAHLGTDAVGTSTVIAKHSGNTFAFKPSDVGGMELVSGWNVNPNPTIDEMTVQGKKGAEYSLTDMTGRVLIHGTTTGGSDNISICLLRKECT